MNTDLLTNREKNIRLIKALLLNKVERLDWYYFDLDLNEETIQTKSQIKNDIAAREANQVPSGNKSNLASNPKEEELLSKKLSIKVNNTWTEFFYLKDSDPNKTPSNEIFKCVLEYLENDPGILREVILRLFDMNQIPNESMAQQGMMGKLNLANKRLRNKKFYKLLRKKKFREIEENIVALAEGDSWFQFPRIGVYATNFLYRTLGRTPVKDILDHLIRDKAFKKVAVYSLADGGDWLSNMFYMKEYIEELPIISPDVFLVSGGGNDLVGERLGLMVRNPRMEGRRKVDQAQKANNTIELAYRLINIREKKMKDKRRIIDLDIYKKGISLLSDDFFNFLNIILAQYVNFFSSLLAVDKYRNLLILTHGYDFVIPSNERNGTWISWQRVLNIALDTGGWLYTPLVVKGITDPKEQEAVMYAMIYEFNEMMIQLAEKFENVVHIDCRGVAEHGKDWFDELHLKSHKYREIAKVYHQCMNDFIKNGRTPLQTNVYQVGTPNP